MPFNPEVIKRQLTALRAAHPELIEDGESWLLSIESETDFDAMLTQIVRAMEDAAALENGTKERLDMLKSRKERFAYRQEALRTLALKLMESAEIEKRELSEATFSIRNAPPSVIIVEETQLPDSACRFERKPDKTKIKELLKAGPVAGAVMSNGTRSLTIRIK